MAVGELWLDCSYDEEGKLVYDQDSHRQASLNLLPGINSSLAASPVCRRCSMTCVDLCSALVAAYRGVQMLA